MSKKNITTFVKDVLLTFPEASYKQLVLLTWKLFDGIDIPDSVYREIIESGSNPETIGRKRRLNLLFTKKPTEYVNIRDVFIEAQKEYMAEARKEAKNERSKEN